jgi:hypothetical protein
VSTVVAIAPLRRLFQGLALITSFAAAATAQTHPLIGITGDGASIPESLFLLDPTNASAMFVMALGNGSEGEAIGYNSDDGLLYHASGLLQNEVWESVDVYARTIVASGPFTGQQVNDYENTAIVYDPATGRFLVCDLIGNLFDTTLAGAATKTGAVPDTLKGLAFAGGSLYGASNADERLYTLNPANGHALSSVAVTLDGIPVTGMNGLATHPGTGALWGIFRVGNSPGVRHLGTVDPTGVVTSVGVLPYNFAGIAFLPEPSPIFALGAGALAVALCAGRRRRCPPIPERPDAVVVPD